MVFVIQTTTHPYTLYVKKKIKKEKKTNFFYKEQYFFKNLPCRFSAADEKRHDRNYQGVIE